MSFTNVVSQQHSTKQITSLIAAHVYSTLLHAITCYMLLHANTNTAVSSSPTNYTMAYYMVQHTCICDSYVKTLFSWISSPSNSNITAQNETARYHTTDYTCKTYWKQVVRQAIHNATSHIPVLRQRKAKGYHSRHLRWKPRSCRWSKSSHRRSCSSLRYVSHLKTGGI